MRIKEIHVSYSRTFNLGNYENVKIEAGLEAELEEYETDPETAEQCFDNLRQAARDQVAQEYSRLEAGRE